jgi:Tol biopolymer transport system component
VGFEERGIVEGNRWVESSIELYDTQTGERRIIYQETRNGRIEAPNFTPDGTKLLVNTGGLLYTIPVSGGERVQLNTGPLNRINNDHGFSADGQWLAISDGTQSGGSRIYILPAEGADEPRQVTPLAPSYWHGWSPDGKYLTYPAQRDGEFDIYIIPTEGGEEIKLTEAEGLDDGSDYTPDGNYIWFNSVRLGVMKLFRMAPDGSNEEQMTFNEEYGDWFPHPSPDGRFVSFLSFDRSVEGHPVNRDVVLRLMPAEGGEPEVIATLFGGQGTFNVPNWSPDSRYIAFVSYRLVIPPPESM